MREAMAERERQTQTQHRAEIEAMIAKHARDLAAEQVCMRARVFTHSQHTFHTCNTPHTHTHAQMRAEEFRRDMENNNVKSLQVCACKQRPVVHARTFGYGDALRHHLRNVLHRCNANMQHVRKRRRTCGRGL